jgi:PAS domain S-box-containing protein
MRILLAEDNAVNLKLLRVTLNAEGIETLEATDGLQALALLREHRVEGIISDILMPNMDGFRLCHEVRRSPEWHHLPFIFYTSTYDSGEDERVALNMGADRFFRKPQPVRVMIEALQEIISKGPRVYTPIDPAHEAELMTKYSERLVCKLEDQITELRKRSGELAEEVTERRRAERRAEESLALTQRSGQALLRRVEEQEQAELSLRESEQNLRLALEAAQMGTFDWDIPKKRLKWSRWHEQMWGFDRGEFPGSFDAFSERVHPEDLPLVQARIDACIATREPYQMEFRLVWPDGSLHWIQARGEFAYDIDGKPSRMRGVVVETTAQKQVEEALRASEERLVEAQALARVGSWQTEFPGLEVTWSDQTHRIFETDPSTYKVTHPEFMSRVHPDDRERVQAAFAASGESAAPCSVEHRIVVSGGVVKHVEERWQVLFDAHDRPVRAVGTCRDITAEVQTQEKMAAQLDELRRWQATMLGREERNQELKREVNELCRKLGEPIRYPSQNLPPL